MTDKSSWLGIEKRSKLRDQPIKTTISNQEGVKAFLKLLLCIPNIFKNYKSIWFKVVFETNSLLAKDSISNLKLNSDHTIGKLSRSAILHFVLDSKSIE